MHQTHLAPAESATSNLSKYCHTNFPGGISGSPNWQVFRAASSAGQPPDVGSNPGFRWESARYGGFQVLPAVDCFGNTCQIMMLQGNRCVTFSSSTLGFSVKYLEGGLVSEGPEGVIFLYSDLIVQVERKELGPGQTAQEAAEAFIRQLEGSVSLMKLQAQPLGIPGVDAYLWDVYPPGLLLARTEEGAVGLAYVATWLTDTDFAVNTMLPVGLDMLGSFRFLQP